MKRVVVLLLFLVAFGSGPGLIVRSATASDAPQDVVILWCVIQDGSPRPVNVVASSSSPGAPTITDNTSCAAALASLLTAGFKQTNVSAVMGTVQLFTLIRH